MPSHVSSRAPDAARTCYSWLSRAFRQDALPGKELRRIASAHAELYKGCVLAARESGTKDRSVEIPLPHILLLDPDLPF